MNKESTIFSGFIDNNIIGMNSLIKSLFTIFSNFIEKYSVEFIKFLVERNVFHIGIGILISTQLSTLSSSITEVVVAPIANKMSGGEAKYVKDWKITIMGIEFKLGLLIGTFFNFLFMLFIIFNIWRIIDLKNYDFVNKIVKK
jgi:large-conductance mechanosensitive channel